MARFLRRVRQRAGQAAVLIALTLFSLVIFLAMATNVGILVNDKIRIQNAADMAAYGAAYKEAQQLNKLVQINKQILEVARRCRQTLTSTVWTGEICTCENTSPQAELVIEACQQEMDLLAQQFEFEASYQQTVAQAKAVAQSTLDANVSGLGSNLDFFDAASSSATRSGAYRLATTNAPALANFERVEDTIFNYPVLKQCPFGPSCISVGPVPSPNYDMETWYHKDDKNPDVWVMVAVKGTMQSKYLDIDGGGSSGYFGSSSDGGAPDTMYAVGVAKPYDGSVGPSEAPADFYRNANLPDGPYYTPSSIQYPEEAMIDEYRARLAGINEWDGASADYKPKSALSQARFGAISANVNKFRH